MAQKTETTTESSTQPVNGSETAEEPLASTPVFQAVVDETLARQQAQLDYTRQKFDFEQRRARMYARSKLFVVKDMPEEQAIAQAMVKINLGESMGFSDAESLAGIYVINGQTAISAQLRASRMQMAGYSWTLEWIEEKGECAGCRVWLYKDGKPLLNHQGGPISEAFTRKDAERMLTTLWEDGGKRRVSILEKDNWKMSPRNMYFARAITNAQRFYAPHVLKATIASLEEVLDRDFEPPYKERERATLQPEHLTLSGDANRGHDAAMPKTAAAAAGAEPEKPLTPEESDAILAKLGMGSEAPPVEPAKALPAERAKKGQPQKGLGWE